MFEELNINFNGDDDDYNNIFNFIHQSHKDRFIPSVLFPKRKNPFDAIDRYNEMYKSLFMKNRLCSKMFYFVFKNYLDQYYPDINHRYRREIGIKL